MAGTTMQMDPSWDDLERLPTPLAPGERRCLEFFEEHLDHAWECYVQPYVNGLRPDLVLLNQYAGLYVFEIKDWSRSTLQMATARYRGEKGPRGKNPWAQVALYRDEFTTRCELSGAKGQAPVVAGLIFTQISREEAVAALDTSRIAFGCGAAVNHPIVGADDLAAGRLKVALTKMATPDQTTGMTPALADRLRPFLVMPEFAADQVKPLPLTTRQRALATSGTGSGYRRVKGPAGSGKSVVLAARAARLAADGQRVLVVSYNITLWHYLRDLCMREVRALAPHDVRETASRITFLNYHELCRRICLSAGYEEEYRQLWTDWEGDGPPTDGITRVATEAVRASAEKYDAVLVDEGQDLEPSWWNMLRGVVREEGERWLVADASQDIYATAGTWTEEAMSGAGFVGPWAQLDGSHRLPVPVADMLRDFGATFLGASFDPPISTQLELPPTTMRWVAARAGGLEVAAADEIALAWQAIESEDVLALADVVIVCPAKALGQKVVGELHKRHRLRVRHTFDADSDKSRTQKAAFYLGDARIKGTTPHSIKGWEARAIVAVFPSMSERTRIPLYVAMSRTKASEAGAFLTVVTPDRSLDGFASEHFTMVETAGAS